MTTLSLPTYDPAALAGALKERGLPGQRSKTAITKLRRERRARTGPSYVQPSTVQDRLNARLVAIYSDEITRRGGETMIQTGKNSECGLSVTDRRGGLTLLNVDGWRYYSTRGQWRASLSYLCGTDDSGRWAVRVPGNITTVAKALEWVTPADVRKAEWNGLRVRRQGDIYAIETTRTHDTPSCWIGDDRRYDAKAGEWVTSHYWNAGTRTLVHRPEDGRKHRPLRISYPVRFAQQRTYGMGRGTGRANGD
jgi:hypothetical protein